MRRALKEHVDDNVLSAALACLKGYEHQLTKEDSELLRTCAKMLSNRSLQATLISRILQATASAGIQSVQGQVRAEEVITPLEQLIGNAKELEPWDVKVRLVAEA